MILRNAKKPLAFFSLIVAGVIGCIFNIDRKAELPEPTIGSKTPLVHQKIYMQPFKELVAPASEPNHANEDSSLNIDWFIANCESESIAFQNFASAYKELDGILMEKWAKRIQELSPFTYQSTKNFLLADLVQLGFPTGHVIGDIPYEELSERFEHHLRKAKDFGVNDPDLVFIDSIAHVRTMDDIQNKDFYGDELVSRYPESGLGYYAIASAYFQAGEENETIMNALLKAIELEPQNAEYRIAHRRFLNGMKNDHYPEGGPFDRQEFLLPAQAFRH